MNIFIIIIMAAFGLAGCWYHWLEVVKRGQPGTFFQYFFISETPSSTATVVAWLAAMESVFIVGGFSGLDFGLFITALKTGVFYQPMFTAISLSFTAGYMADSKLNKMGALPDKQVADPLPEVPMLNHNGLIIPARAAVLEVPAQPEKPDVKDLPTEKTPPDQSVETRDPFASKNLFPTSFSVAEPALPATPDLRGFPSEPLPVPLQPTTGAQNDTVIS